MEEFGWPWTKLEQIGETGVYVGGNKILTPFERGWVEHFWFKGQTLFRKVSNIHTKDHIKINKHVYNIVFPRSKALMLVDYKNKKKVYLVAEDFNMMKKEGTLRVKGDNVILPIINIEEYTPDKRYNQFAD